MKEKKHSNSTEHLYKIFIYVVLILLAVIIIVPVAWVFMASIKQTEQGTYINLEPDKTQTILKSVGEEMEKMEELGKNPIIVTSPIVRLYFKKLTEEQFQDLIVVSYNEIDSNVELQSIGMVTV